MLPLIRLERTRVGRYIEATRNQNLRRAMDARLALRDADRQRRILDYQERASQQSPLFGQSSAAS